MRRKVPLRQAAIAGIARRELGLTTREASRVLGKNETTITNWEGCACPMSEETTRRVLAYYIAKLSPPGAVPDTGGLSADQLTERLGLVLLARYAARVGDLLSAVQSGGIDQALDFVVQHGLRADIVNSKFAERMRRSIYAERFVAKRDARERTEQPPA